MIETTKFTSADNKSKFADRVANRQGRWIQRAPHLRKAPIAWAVFRKNNSSDVWVLATVLRWSSSLEQHYKQDKAHAKWAAKRGKLVPTTRALSSLVRRMYLTAPFYSHIKPIDWRAP